MKPALTLFLFILTFALHADTTTFVLTNAGPPATASITLASNQTVRVVYWAINSTGNSAGATLKWQLQSGETFTLSTNFYSQNGFEGPLLPFVGQLPIIAGPATVTLINNYGGCSQTCTMDITTQSPTPSAIPSNTVVIPSDTNGPVTILLESSSDLVNWVQANPGTYGTTYSNRFFRVRAVR